MEGQPRASRAMDREMAASSPDVNALFRGLVLKFLRIGKWHSITFAAFLVMLWTVAAIGVPAMLSGAVLLDKAQEAAVSKREYQLKMFELQTDLEISKLDRTMLGEGAMKTLNQISDKLDGQGEAIKTQGEAIERISADVASLSKSQQASDRRIAGVAAEQRELKSKVQTIRPVAKVP